MSVLAVAPEGAVVLDLGAARAARAEVRVAAGVNSSFIKLAAGYVEVRAEFALATAEALQAGRISDGLAGLLADPADVDALLADGLTAQDLEELTKFIAGSSLGE